jgi:preprotein translocase subunit SecG
MQTFLTVLQVFLSVALIGLVLIQHGRGADAGAAFGSGASATVFGAQGSGSFLTRMTGIIAALFFLTSMAMAYYAAKGSKPAGLMEGADGVRVKVEAPAQRSETPAPVEQPAASPSEVPFVPGAAPKAPSSDVPTAPPAAATSAAPGASDVPAVPAANPEAPKVPDGAPKPPAN